VLKGEAKACFFRVGDEWLEAVRAQFSGKEWAGNHTEGDQSYVKEVRPSLSDTKVNGWSSLSYAQFWRLGSFPINQW